MVQGHPYGGFEGTTSHTCDEKGRLIVPSKFRDVVKSTGNEILTLTKGLDKTLYGYTLDSWTKKKRQLSELRSANAPTIKRHFLGSAVTCTFDKQGRILIQKELREYAEIEKEIKLVGLDDYFEIWSQERWSEINDKDQEKLNSQEVLEELAKAGMF